ncbi:uncharacterized protein CEXT_487881, partial [Caerostris extrusa]
LYAGSTNGESLFLIDSSGCPTDATIFPALQLDPTDHKSLLSTFKAFRFPSSGMVNFEVSKLDSVKEKCEQNKFSFLDDEDVYFDHDNYDSIRAVVQEEPQSMVLSVERRLQT